MLLFEHPFSIPGSFCADGDGLDGDRRPKTSGIGPAAGVPLRMGHAGMFKSAQQPSCKS